MNRDEQVAQAERYSQRREEFHEKRRSQQLGNAANTQSVQDFTAALHVHRLAA